MKHYRRKLLLKAINNLYLDNLTRVKSFAELNTLEGHMSEVGNRLRWEAEKEARERGEDRAPKQLTLF